MLIDVIFLATSIFFIYQLPSGLSLWANLWLYACLVWFQHCFASVGRTSVVLLASYGSLTFLYYFIGCADVLPLTGSVIYGVFAAQHGWKLARGFRNPEERARNAFFLALASGSLGLSLLLRPDPSYIYLPLALYFLGVVGRRRFEASLQAPAHPEPRRSFEE